MSDAVTLPIDEALPRLARALRDHPCVVLQAPPGAGKTTRVPTALLGEPWLDGKKIIVLEPRRLAARSAAAHMAVERGERPGETIGYRVRMESKVGPSTRIEIITEGILTRQLLADPGLSEAGLVIFDEFHERSLQADLGLALCRQAQELLRPDLRLLIMSATIDGARVVDKLGNATLVESQGRSFPVQTNWIDRPANPPIDRQVTETVERAIGSEQGSCLVFLPGRAEIDRVSRQLQSSDLPANVDVLPLYGDLSLSAQAKVIEPPPKGRRKVVLSTAIAETSLTIEGIRIVIDAGLARRLVHDPKSGMDRLVTGSVTRAEADQRRGRAGRTEPGTCYRLWPKASEGALETQPKPEILSVDLTSLALDLAAWGAQPEELNWIDPPPMGAYSAAVSLLAQLGALDAKGQITAHGRAMAGLPLHPRLAHMVVMGRTRGWGATACCLAVLLGERDPIKGQTDLAHRLALMAAPAGPWIPLTKLAKRVARVAHIRFDDGVEPSLAGSLTAFAYPDRIAQLRDGRAGRYLLTGGRGATLSQDDPLAASDYLAVADLDGAGEARIYRAATLDRSAIEDLFADDLEAVDTVAWDRRNGRIVARQERRLASLLLESKPMEQPPSDRLVGALMDAVRDRGLPVLNWSPASARLRQRVVFVATQFGEDWPDWSDEGLMATLEQWLAPWCAGLQQPEDFERLDLPQILKSALGWERVAELDKLAPNAIAIPSGRQAAIDYADPAAPVLAVKLQVLFGLSRTPRVADGRVPLVIHLLSPAGRPLAVTTDLAGFWHGGYREVRKEMRGRYPKHPWPEDPTQAEATASLARRSGHR
ncbi:MAG: ATP-dependent helicase HrpB [Pseudomonadota bacterium]